MNRQKLTELVNNPEKISQRDIALLTDMAEQYPYATVIQILLAKSKQQQPDARQALATAALYTPNRQVLRQVIENNLPPLSYTESSYSSSSAAKQEIPAQAEHTPQVAAEQTEEPAELKQTQEQYNTTPEPQNASITADQEHIQATTTAAENTDEETDTELPPQADNNLFDDLHKNLKRLREERTKWHAADSGPEQEGSSNHHDKDQPLAAYMPPTIQQVVEDHQQQPLENPKVQEQRNLIDSFLENAANFQRRQAQPAAHEGEVADLSANTGLTPQDLATETLAKIMERQGKTEKAIDIYQKLLLKFPQKSVYFANCIERLKKDL